MPAKPPRKRTIERIRENDLRITTDTITIHVVLLAEDVLIFTHNYTRSNKIRSTTLALLQPDEARELGEFLAVA